MIEVVELEEVKPTETAWSAVRYDQMNGTAKKTHLRQGEHDESSSAPEDGKTAELVPVSGDGENEQFNAALSKEQTQARECARDGSEGKGEEELGAGRWRRRRGAVGGGGVERFAARERGARWSGERELDGLTAAEGILDDVTLGGRQSRGGGQ